jgi:non-heme chloroperoxidase
MRLATLFVRLTIATATLSAQESIPLTELKTVRVADGVELHYIERGKGDPVIFIHGGLLDYSMWDSQLGPFAERYRTILYSRRYNHPNTNQLQPNYSPFVDAEDLAALIKRLDLGKVHVVGASFGGRVALFFAVKHPELVRSVILQELPIQFTGDPPDEPRLQFDKALRSALEQGKREEVMGRILDRVTGGKVSFKDLPPDRQNRMRRNFPEFEAFLRSDVSPAIDRDAVRMMNAPTLLLSGEKSPPTFKPLEKELLRLLPNRQHIVISGAEHALFRTHAQASNRAMFEFLKGK